MVASGVRCERWNSSPRTQSAQAPNGVGKDLVAKLQELHDQDDAGVDVDRKILNQRLTQGCHHDLGRRGNSWSIALHVSNCSTRIAPLRDAIDERRVEICSRSTWSWRRSRRDCPTHSAANTRSPAAGKCASPAAAVEQQAAHPRRGGDGRCRRSFEAGARDDQRGGSRDAAPCGACGSSRAPHRTT